MKQQRFMSIYIRLLLKRGTGKQGTRNGERGTGNAKMGNAKTGNAKTGNAKTKGNHPLWKFFMKHRLQ